MSKKPDKPARKLFGLRLDQALMREVNHLATDEDKYVNELVEMALQDLLKKYREKRKETR